MVCLQQLQDPQKPSCIITPFILAHAVLRKRKLKMKTSPIPTRYLPRRRSKLASYRVCRSSIDSCPRAEPENSIDRYVAPATPMSPIIWRIISCSLRIRITASSAKRSLGIKGLRKHIDELADAGTSNKRTSEMLNRRGHLLIRDEETKTLWLHNQDYSSSVNNA